METGFQYQARGAQCFGATLVLFMIPGGALATIVNPSFEADGRIRFSAGAATGWVDNIEVQPFGGDVDFSYDTPPRFVSDGLYSARIFSTVFDTFDLGEEGHLRQAFTATDSSVTAILFDAQLEAHGLNGPTAWNPDFTASVLLDGAQVWARQANGTFLDQAIPVYPGDHTLEFRLTAINAVPEVPQSSNWFTFDNVREIPEPVMAYPLALIGMLIGRRRRTPRVVPTE